MWASNRLYTINATVVAPIPFPLRPPNTSSLPARLLKIPIHVGIRQTLLI